MPKTSRFLIIALLFSLASFAQVEEQWIKGKVYSDTLVAMGVNVLNLVNEKTAITDGNGEFRILAKEDDMIVFPSEKYEYKRKIITVEDLRKGEISVTLVPKIIELDEVVVNRDISPESLGIVPKGQKKYTPAERRLYTARSGPVDALVNALNGRTKMLKKIAATEKQERLLEKLSAMYTEEYYVEKLKIPNDYVKAFQYFAIDDKEVVTALNSKNKGRTKLALIKLAPVYLELLKDEGIMSESKD